MSTSGAGEYEEFLLPATQTGVGVSGGEKRGSTGKWVWVLGGAVVLLLSVTLYALWCTRERKGGAARGDTDPFFSSFRSILSGGGRVTP